MKGFRKFLEEFRPFKGDEGMGIFKNPTPEEIKLLPKDVRGIVSKDGDVYIANTSHGWNGMHSQMRIRLAKIYKGAKLSDKGMTIDYKDGVTIQRVGKSKTFVLGETSPYTEQPRRLGATELLKTIKPHLQKAKKKNPGLKFVMRNISEVGDRFE